MQRKQNGYIDGWWFHGKFTIGSTTYYVNGQTKEMDVTPVIKNDRTFFPARFVAEALGYTVEWDASQEAVIVYKRSQPSVGTGSGSQS